MNAQQTIEAVTAKLTGEFYVGQRVFVGFMAGPEEATITRLERRGDVLYWVWVHLDRSQTAYQHRMRPGEVKPI